MRITTVALAAALTIATIAPRTVADDAPPKTPIADQSPNWPSFRGPNASGVADGQNLPDTWNGETGEHILWKTPIPGLAHSSPVVWDGRVYVTTAVSQDAGASFKPGLYGSGDASPDHSVHDFKLYCLDLKTGDVIWERIAYTGVPRSKRHIKATYANCSPAVDERCVVAHFGAEGLHAFDHDGNKLWSKDLGDLDVGAYDLPEYEWGPASSPILFRDMVIVQCDTQQEDFLLACNRLTGEAVWRTQRDELPSWGTPTVIDAGGRLELVTNASNFIRGYDPLTGRELWRLGRSSKITAPTPICAGKTIIVASGRGPEKPILAVRAGVASGDITPADGETAHGALLWSKRGKGPYMPTPIAYGDLLYSCNNDGILTCIRYETGEQVYRVRVPHQGAGFSASPVAADGRIYLTSEDGDIIAFRAGPEFEVLATNPMGELLMATPALSDGRLIVRGQHHVSAVGSEGK